MTEKETRDYWSECGQVFFLDGYGWGLTEELERISLGKEEDIKRFFDTGELSDKLHPSQKQVLRQIWEYRETGKYGKGEENGIREADMVRAGNDGAIGSKQEAVSTTKKGQRLALRASHKKHNHIL